MRRRLWSDEVQWGAWESVHSKSDCGFVKTNLVCLCGLRALLCGAAIQSTFNH